MERNTEGQELMAVTSAEDCKDCTDFDLCLRHECAMGCGLRAAKGDIYCEACRSSIAE